MPFFALKFIVNYSKVKLFTDSQLGWLYDERDLPFWTYDAPYLMRDTYWLQWWGGQRIRSLGSVPVSIIDVRPADMYNQGHVPFALNIPVDIFRNSIKNLGELTKVLGANGVNPKHEAVIISGAGLNKESALAFLLLEKLGQKKISVFMDSLEQWEKLGFSLKKEPTVVAPKKVRHDLSIPPVDYPKKPRQDVIITDYKSTKGIYPKVFINSGKEALKQTMEGKVVHVPYTDLINPDGTTKPAKDIWNILVKAGVPRYAEIICVAEDLGEAAINYFILKLMGYPDIKVFVL